MGRRKLPYILLLITKSENSSMSMPPLSTLLDEDVEHIDIIVIVAIPTKNPR